MQDYTIAENAHVFACWAAGRAASVRIKGRSFTVQNAKSWLEGAGFNQELNIEHIPNDLTGFDNYHEDRCEKLIKEAKQSNDNFKHGQAAKLINVYMKARFLNECTLNHDAVKYIHPPIDRLLLMALGNKNSKWADGKDGWMGKGKYWRKMAITGWSNFAPTQYQSVINEIREGLSGEPLWKVEYYWKGHQ